MALNRVKVLCVVGARPNFMKVVPVLRALRSRPAFAVELLHTGQHYDAAMSEVFLEELGVGAPDHMLGVGSGTHAAQTARVMELIEPVLMDRRPELLLVPGDVNSTLAAALVASKLQIPVGHIEAGLRSFDRGMPEEINRILTDHIAELLFIHSPEARDNLLREGADGGQIHDVGNTMIDTLVAAQSRIRRPEGASGHLVVTLHRPALVDGPLLAPAIRAVDAIADQLPVVFPCHPRTRDRLERSGALPANPAVRLTEPLGYFDFLGLVSSAAGVLTDSGGLQEETTYLGIPCFTLRDNTERPVTISQGTNVLLGLDPEAIRDIPNLVARMSGKPRSIPSGWDGQASERVADVIERWAASAGR